LQLLTKCVDEVFICKIRYYVSDAQSDVNHRDTLPYEDRPSKSLKLQFLDDFCSIVLWSSGWIWWL